MPRSRSSKNNSSAILRLEANLPLAAASLFNHSDTASRGSAISESRPDPQVVREAQDNFRKDDDVRWQWREATGTINGSPKGEHNPAHQYPSPQRGNANFAWVQHFIHHLAPHGMAGSVLVRFWFWIETLIPPSQFTRGDRPRFPRVQRIASSALYNTLTFCEQC